MKGCIASKTPTVARRRSAIRRIACLLLLLGGFGFSPVRAEVDARCLEIYLGTGAIPVGPDATPQELLECEITAANFHSNLGNYYCKNHTDEYCGKDCSAYSDLHLCFTDEEEEEDEDKEKEDCDTEGNPCNPSSGNKQQREADYRSGDGRLELVRRYNSLNPQDGPFGYGWSATGLAHLTIGADQIRVHQTTGRSEPWSLVNGQWQGDPDSRLKLVAEGDGYRLENPDLSVEHYDIQGRLMSRTGIGGLSLNYAYDAAGRLQTMSSPFGRALEFRYDGEGHVLGVQTPDGELGYRYDPQGNLSEVAYPDGTTRTYHYEDTAHPHNLTGLSDERGKRLATWSYQADGRVILSEHAGGVERVEFSYDTDTTGVTGALGEQRTYRHQLIHGVRKITEVSGDPCATCGNGQLQSRSYDADGFLVGYRDWNGNETRLVRNARHLTESRTEAAGTPQERTTTTEWHPDFDLPVRIVEAERTTELSYDPATRNLLGRSVIDTAGGERRTTTYSYHPQGSPGAGLISAVDGPRRDVDDTTHYDYDDQGNLIAVTNPLGQTTRITAHDPSGRPLTMVDANGLSTQLGYDSRGRLTRQSLGDGTTSRTSNYGYDPAGNLTEVSAPDGGRLIFHYDAASRLVGLEDGAGNRLDATLDLQGHPLETRVSDPDGVLSRRQRQVYNQLGRLIRSLDAQERITAYDYDANGNLTQTADARQNPTRRAYDALERLRETTDALDGVTQYRYDTRDNLTGVTDPNGLTTTYEYDGLGNLLRRGSPDTGITTYAYDEAGNRTGKTDAKGQSTAYAYDALNRLTRIDHPDGRQTLYVYDECDRGIGRLCRIIDANATTEWSYNVYGDITGKRQSLEGLTLNTGYDYDEGGRLSRMTYPSGKGLAYRYDAQGKLLAIDLDGEALIGGIEYLPFGPVRGWSWSNGRSERRDYDLDGRLTDQTLGGDERHLDYDPAGNITALRDPHAELDLDYDALDRLIEASAADYALSWSYDANGNRLGRILDGEAEPYSYIPQSNRLGQAGAQSYGHDANGNRTDDGAHRYGYDSDNRLIEVDEGATARYRHNTLGQRISKSTYAGGDGTDYLALAEAAEAQAQAHREEAGRQEVQAQEAEAGAANLQSQAEELQRQAAQGTLEAEALARFSEEARRAAESLREEASGLREQAAGYRSKIDPDPGNFKERLQNALYKAQARAAEALAAKAEEGAGTLEARAGELEVLAEAKRMQAEAQAQQVATWRQEAQALAAQATQLREEAQGQLRLAEEAQAQAAEYRRLAEANGGGGETKTLFVYDERGRLIGEYDASGQPRQETVYLGELPVATLQGGEVYAIHTDHLGAPRVITDANQREVWRWDSEPFGSTPANEDPDQDGVRLSYNLRFPGQYYDAETGLHYNYFRDYDPSTGRYLQSDPIGLNGGINTYAYVRNKPLELADYYGLFDVGGTHINIAGIQGYSFEVTFYDTWLRQFGRDWGRSGVKSLDRIARALGMLSNKTGVSDVSKFDRGECDDFDEKAKDIYEEMFGSTENKINETQLNDYLRRLEATKGYPNEWYPPRNDFIRNAIDRAYPSPRDIFNDLAR